jgi:threonine dehydratase/serine racemase
MTRHAAELADIRAAAKRIAPYAHRTPVLTCNAVNDRAGRQLFFKCENLQKVGAFKFRGACNAVIKLTDDVARRGVVTHSSGNHAQALALAAKLRGIPAHIVMPTTSSRIKREGVIGYGGIVHDCEPNVQARESTAARIVKETGGTLIHPYDNADIIAGQGTAALELLTDYPDLKAIISSVGGGGLMSGTSIAARGLNPAIRTFGAEPSAVDDAARSLATGTRQPAVSNPKTSADGLLTNLGELTWPIIRDHVEHIFTVTEDEIIDAMRFIWQRMKIIIEPSSAVPVAALFSDEARTRLGGVERVGVILSGGNVDLDKLPWI